MGCNYCLTSRRNTLVQRLLILYSICMICLLPPPQQMKWCSSPVRSGLCINRLVILKLQVIGIDKLSHGRRRPAMLLLKPKLILK